MTTVVAEGDRVVAQVGEGEPCQLAVVAQVLCFRGGKHGDALAGEPLGQGVHELAVAGVIGGGHLQVGQAVDDYPAGLGALDGA